MTTFEHPKVNYTAQSTTPPTHTPGYRTIVGDGTGILLPPYAALRLALARALVRRPSLLLVDDAPELADALPGGVPALAALIASAAAAGCAVVATARPGAAAEELADALDARMATLRDGSLVAGRGSGGDA